MARPTARPLVPGRQRSLTRTLGHTLSSRSLDAKAEKTRVSERCRMRASHRTDGARVAHLRAPRAHRAGTVGQGLAVLRAKKAAETQRHRDAEGIRNDVGTDPNAARSEDSTDRSRPSNAAARMQRAKGGGGQGPRPGSDRSGDDRIRKTLVVGRAKRGPT